MERNNPEIEEDGEDEEIYQPEDCQEEGEVNWPPSTEDGE